VATDGHLDPALAAAVTVARARAEAAGELRSAGSGAGFVSPLSQEAREAIDEWVRSGGYREAVARVVADDPDLADQ
jgi:hypothetical protein